MNQEERQVFLAELQELIERHRIEPYFFYGADTEGTFGDYKMVEEEIKDMVFDILQHEDFSAAAEAVSQEVATELMGLATGDTGGDESLDLSQIDEMKWTSRKKL